MVGQHVGLHSGSCRSALQMANVAMSIFLLRKRKRAPSCESYAFINAAFWSDVLDMSYFFTVSLSSDFGLHFGILFSIFYTTIPVAHDDARIHCRKSPSILVTNVFAPCSYREPMKTMMTSGLLDRFYLGMKMRTGALVGLEAQIQLSRTENL
jgi:hypothetical protein